MSQDSVLQGSRRHCREVTEREAGNFRFAIRLLPREKRDAVFAVYAFMRKADDLVDAGESMQGAKGIEAWREKLKGVYRGESDEDPVLPALRNAVEEFEIPERYFHELLDGVSQDLSKTRYETFEELRAYCYRVASVVGFTLLHVLGLREEDFQPHAESLGIAFQLTNILRDVKEDLSLGRIYIPQEDLRLFGCSEEELASGTLGANFKNMMLHEYRRAEQFYEGGLPLLRRNRFPGRRAVVAMCLIYRGILRKVRRRDFDVFSERVRLPSAEKYFLVARALAFAR